MTTIGMVWEATSRGYVVRRSVREKCSATAQATPAPMATAIPSSTSPAVTRKSCHSSARSSRSACAISVGAGRRKSSTPPSLA